MWYFKSLQDLSEKIRVFRLTCDDGEEFRPQSLTELLIEVERWQHQSGDRPVVVSCM